MALSRPKKGIQENPTWIWHPYVHSFYNEKLCYFLIAIKPFNRAVFEERLNSILKQYGVDKACHFELLGNFDILVRVWLIQGARGAFERKVTEIPNCKHVASFEVDVAELPWGFPKDEEPKESDLERLTANPDLIKKIQSGELATGDRVEQLISGHLLSDARLFESAVKEPIKGFVSISAHPEFYGNPQRSRNLVKNIVTYLKSPQSKVKDSALYIGIGFAWVFVKVLVDDFYAIGNFVDWLHKGYSFEGISTNTFVVSGRDWNQGEGISEFALREARGLNPNVWKVVPLLYDLPPDVPPLNEQERGVFEEEIIAMKADAAEGNISPQQFAAAIKFLEAVLKDKRLDCFSALYESIGLAEERLRDGIERVAATVMKSPGNLLNELNSQQDSDSGQVKKLSTLALGDLFRAWMILLKQAGQTVTNPDLTQEKFAEVTRMRNHVMHFGKFAPREQWQPWLKNLLWLYKVVPTFEEATLRLKKPLAKPQD